MDAVGLLPDLASRALLGVPEQALPGLESLALLGVEALPRDLALLGVEKLRWCGGASMGTLPSMAETLARELHDQTKCWAIYNMR